MIKEVSFVVPLFATRWAIKRGLKECIEFYASRKIDALIFHIECYGYKDLIVVYNYKTKTTKKVWHDDEAKCSLVDTDIKKISEDISSWQNFIIKYYLKNFISLFRPASSVAEPESSIFDYIEDFNAND